MSGFEIAGVVLGVIPLIITALEHYKAGKGAAAAFIKWGGQLDQLIFRLKSQRTIFYLHMEELLRHAGIEEVVDRIDLTEEECVAILRNTRVAHEIQEYLGSVYELVEEILRRYEECLKTLARKLSHIRRPENVKQDDLVAILVANPFHESGFSFLKRLKFTIERGSLKSLIDELSEDRLSMKTIISRVKARKEHSIKDASRSARRLARVYTRINHNCTPLLKAICQACNGSCTNEHKALMKLDSRAPKALEPHHRLKNPSEDVAFHLFIQLGDQYLESVVRVKSSNGEDCVGLSRGTHDGQVSVITFPAIRIIGTDVASQALAANHSLGLELHGELLLASTGKLEPQRYKTSAMTLNDLLRIGCQNESSRMTPKQQTRCALDLAASIIQLRGTSWLDPEFTNKTIKVLSQEFRDNTQQGILSFAGLFVEQTYSVGLSDRTKHLAGPDPKIALLELAILLLEIWNHKPLEVWAANVCLGDFLNDLKSPEIRHIAAIRWLQESEERLPRYHLEAIEQCLAICAGRIQVWHNEEFLVKYCENIIKPLQESCKAW
ncbi:hypothetical protein G7054_g5932 [Neopestalotiopsis clavispora]|nr:hypothetical protein G7054_g5932 [Neopestalotiopsis clavispora]